MKRILIVVAIFLASGVPRTYAEGVNVGVGAATCADYTAAFNEKDPSGKRLAVAWVQGFVSGLNIAAPEKQMRRLPDSDVLESELLLYCKDQPGDSIAKASMRIYKKLPLLK